MPERSCVGCTKQKIWGCTAKRIKPAPVNEPDRKANWINPANQPVTIMGETTYACPRQHLLENPIYWGQLLKYYGFYKKGFLPNVGSIADQSNKALEVFQILDDANAQCDREEAARAAKKRGQPPTPGQRR